MTHLFDRLQGAKLPPVQSRYRVIIEDPDYPEGCVGVLIPDPHWLAAALAGGVLPPIETYLRDNAKAAKWVAAHPDEPFAWDKVGGAEHPYAEPISPMTEEQAIEYLIMKDVPAHIWNANSNRPHFKIVRAEAVPADRTYRQAWRLAA